MNLGWLFVIWLALMFGGMPVAFSLGISSAIYILAIGENPIFIAQRMVAAPSFILLAVPFFLLAGNLMNVGGITRRLVEFADVLVGWMRGGLAHVVVVTNMIMAGMSGSAVADATGTGTVLIPALKHDGYPEEYAAALVGAAATIGPIIPPSIPMVIYGVTAGVSVGALFLGGIVPGIIMGLALMSRVARDIPRWRTAQRLRPKAGEALRRTLRALPALLLPAIILGGILGGAFTPTEAAVVASLYAFVLGFFVYRELTLKEAYRAVLDTCETTAVLILIIATANLFGWIMAREQMATLMVAYLTGLSTNPWVILGLLNLLLLFLGTIMDATPIILIVTPLILPVLAKVGIDPVHFGVVMVLNLMIGTLTPPYGILLFMMSKLTGIPFHRVVRAVLPFLIPLLVALVLTTYLPGAVMAIPRWLLG
jgi:tripartite ATP-independent transporter DctM subunit